MDHDYNPGMSEHVWTTGSASWLVPGVVENMIGLRRTYDGIIIKPCIPKEWETVKISREYRGTKYNVTINNLSLKGGNVKNMILDGKEFDFTKPLPIDNAEHEIVVTI